MQEQPTPANISHITEEQVKKSYRCHNNSGHFSNMAAADPAVDNWSTTCVFLRNHSRHSVSMRSQDALRKVNGYLLVGKIPIS